MLSPLPASALLAPISGQRLLSLAGGAFRGYYTACVLAELEARAGEPIGRRFTAIGGSSIGGLLALAIAFEIPMARVLEFFQEHGPRIFPRSRWNSLFSLSGHLFGPGYPTRPLVDAFIELLPAAAPLSSAKHPVFVTTVTLRDATPHLLSSDRQPYRGHAFTALDAALATTAAPILFAPAYISGEPYVDGGLFAANPEVALWARANQRPEPIATLVSIGTMTAAYSLAVPKAPGLLDWFRQFRILFAVMACQQQASAQLLQLALGHRYVRIDAELDAALSEAVGFDRANPQALAIMAKAAKRSVRTALRNKQLIPLSLA